MKPANQWDAKAKPPDNASIDEANRWTINHIAEFQRSHADVPQGDYYEMSKADQMKLVRAYNRARRQASRTVTGPGKRKH